MNIPLIIEALSTLEKIRDELFLCEFKFAENAPYLAKLESAKKNLDTILINISFCINAKIEGSKIIDRNNLKIDKSIDAFLEFLTTNFVCDNRQLIFDFLGNYNNIFSETDFRAKSDDLEDLKSKIFLIISQRFY